VGLIVFRYSSKRGLLLVLSWAKSRLCCLVSCSSVGSMSGGMSLSILFRSLDVRYSCTAVVCVVLLTVLMLYVLYCVGS